MAEQKQLVYIRLGERRRTRSGEAHEPPSALYSIDSILTYLVYSSVGGTYWFYVNRRALGVFCIIYVPMVHAQGPHPQREPHVAYTDHVNASGGIVVFYGEPRERLDFSSSSEQRRSCLQLKNDATPFRYRVAILSRDSIFPAASNIGDDGSCEWKGSFGR